MFETMPRFVTCGQLFDDWQADVLHGEPPRRYAFGEGLEQIQIGPGSVTLLGWIARYG